MKEETRIRLEEIQKAVEEHGWEKFTPIQQKFLVAFDEVGGNVKAACMKSGVKCRQSYYDWIKDEAFKAEVDAIKEENIDYVESKLMNLISQDNPTAILFYLKTIGKNRGYVETIENKVSVNPFEQLMKDLPDDDE